ncbi:MAG TPA: glycoside hydrolase family 97 catalytic domain-containing protein [Ferruginibacter sp.]|nr:glycoside hydrolase family 97 catalytic domain-containing protein [Ferruginibacter sp.]HMP20449.1 glycoside hydrolase family 97 catalytic domain-containing protein [Ferruginibacter sp.]
MKQLIKYLCIFVLILFAATVATAQQQIRVASPDTKLSVQAWLHKGRMYYSIYRMGRQVLQASSLGVIRSDADFSTGINWKAASNPEKITDKYTLLTGKKKNITYQAVRQIIHLELASGKKMNIIFQVSNDAVAFRYHFPDTSTTVYTIKEEITSFGFNKDARTWLQPKAEAQSGWEHTNPSYEENYLLDQPAGISSPSTNGFVYPALFKTGINWVLITEAGLETNYCGTALQQHAPDSKYTIGFPQPAEGMKQQPVYPESTLPWFTPWRVIAVGTLATIIESTAGTDLAKPAVNVNNAFIKPGKASWSWALHHDESISFDIQKKFIDYASDMHWQYCLIDVNWDTRIGYDSVQILSAYAAVKKVGLFLWYNSAGDWNTTPYYPKNKLLNRTERIKEFERIKSMGIKGVKIDFFAGDGQSMIAYYHAILKDAAATGLLVNFHGATLPRGWSRTYPNLMTAEAVKGFEMITFQQQDADREAAHCAMLPFTRNAFDPMDFTPMCLHKIPNIERRTTAGFELALAVLFISGVQHYAEVPEGMAQVPLYVKELLQKLPAIWEGVKFIDGFPGRYIVVARKSGNKWYIAGINGEMDKKQITLDLSFAGKYSRVVYTGDNEAGDAFMQKTLEPGKNLQTTIPLQPNGGFIIELTGIKK